MLFIMMILREHEIVQNISITRMSFRSPHFPVQSQDCTVPLTWRCCCFWGLLPVPEAAGRSTAPPRPFKGCIPGVFHDEFPGTPVRLCLVNITLVILVSTDVSEQLWTAACLYDIERPEMNPLCGARSQHMTKWLLSLFKSQDLTSFGRWRCPHLSQCLASISCSLKKNIWMPILEISVFLYQHMKYIHMLYIKLYIMYISIIFILSHTHLERLTFISNSSFLLGAWPSFSIHTFTQAKCSPHSDGETRPIRVRVINDSRTISLPNANFISRYTDEIQINIFDQLEYIPLNTELKEIAFQWVIPEELQ